MIENMNELRNFIVIAQAGSFTKAAARLVSASALSHSMRKLEEQLKIKLFNRTTRSVATTEAGEQLFKKLFPLFESIEDNMNALSTFRDTLNGTLRINGADHAFLYVIWDKLLAFMQKYPEVKLELTSDMKFADIVAGRFDAGIRLGREVDQVSHLGLALIPKDRVVEELEKGDVVEILSNYAFNHEGYHLYYPNRRQNTPLFRALVEELKA